MSQRKSKAIKQKDRLLSSGLTDLSSHSMSGSQGSDDDDDDTSTPSVDHSDKNSTMFSTRYKAKILLLNIIILLTYLFVLVLKD